MNAYNIIILLVQFPGQQALHHFYLPLVLDISISNQEVRMKMEATVNYSFLNIFSHGLQVTTEAFGDHDQEYP